MTPALGSLILYTTKIDEMIAFYAIHFGYSAHRLNGDRTIELRPPEGAVHLLLYPAAKGVRHGQAAVKLVFACDDVEGFCTKAATRGLRFGKRHRADGYVFANAKDPAGNSVSVSGRFA
ncbi:VOC family protein [Roseobacter weihaiensis]|uniref:VOC family protein n=1 Tax=Roseobacter weihaiensis TaxID=2763262 RepID=UPI001D0AC61F|nr:VOC family protein [Roseobacter sp. H9]